MHWTDGKQSEAAEYLVLKGAHILLQAAQLLLQTACHHLGFSNCCGSCTQAAALDPAAKTKAKSVCTHCTFFTFLAYFTKFFWKDVLPPKNCICLAQNLLGMSIYTADCLPRLTCWCYQVHHTEGQDSSEFHLQLHLQPAASCLFLQDAHTNA